MGALKWAALAYGAIFLFGVLSNNFLLIALSGFVGSLLIIVLAVKLENVSKAVENTPSYEQIIFLRNELRELKEKQTPQSTPA